MSFLELITKRYSVRSFKDMPVEKEKLVHVLEAARLAPSACNLQPWHFIVATDKSSKDKIAQAYQGQWLKDAPVIIVACGDHTKSWKRKDGKDHCDIDLAIAIEHMTLAAAEIGLGTCWVCAFDAQMCHEALELPAGLDPIALLPIGYPANESIPEKDRKTIKDIISWEGYQK